jgi:hypothetical protein
MIRTSKILDDAALAPLLQARVITFDLAYAILNTRHRLGLTVTVISKSKYKRWEGGFNKGLLARCKPKAQLENRLED